MVSAAEQLAANLNFSALAKAEELKKRIYFTVGALLPLVAILLPPTDLRIPVTAAAVLVALTITGAVSARLGGAEVPRAIMRNVVGGALALAITYAIGHLVGGVIG